jgi:two-component system OmpR family response regulator
MRLLVVEDDPRMADLLRRGLAEEGYAVDVTDNGAEALWLATENDYDAVLLDLMLPGIDGYRVCQDLRAAGQPVPVLIITARDGVPDRVRGLDCGADDYLVKPFAFAELTARVRALGRRGDPVAGAVLRCGTLRVDPARHRAWREDVELRVTAREFALLEVFLRHPGEVMTRTRLLEQVWDSAYDGASNVVDQQVVSLRRKIDKPFGRADLQTIRGVGYRLADSRD